MIVLLHILIAISGIIWTTYGYFRPTTTNLRISYALVGLTFATGFYLVWSEPAKILHMCLSGLGYLALVGVGIVLSQRKLSALALEDES